MIRLCVYMVLYAVSCKKVYKQLVALITRRKQHRLRLLWNHSECCRNGDVDVGCRKYLHAMCMSLNPVSYALTDVLGKVTHLQHLDSTPMLLQVIQEMPSGQAVPMLTFVSQSITLLSAAPHNSSTQAAIGQVLATCLALVRVELISAPNLAQAAGQLLTASLQPALAPMLLSTAGPAHQQQAQTDQAQIATSKQRPDFSAQCAEHSVGENLGTLNLSAQHAQHVAGNQVRSDASKTEQLLGCLLRLYHGAVGVHGQCAAMQPQVEPLPGQTTGLPQQGSSSQADQQGNPRPS